MRTSIRLLLVGVLLCIGLQVSEVRAVHAALDDLEPGKYEGFLELHAFNLTTQNGSVGPGVYNVNLDLFWNAEAALALDVTNKKTALLTLIGDELTASIRQSGGADFDVNGVGCAWSMYMLGDGSFDTLYLDINFDGYSTFKLPLRWTKKTTWELFKGSAAGSAPNCSERWDDGLAEIEQKKGVDEVSQQIKEIEFKIASVSQDVIEGGCSLPNWEGTIPIKDGTAEHKVTICDWRVFKTGSKEWQEWGK